jgi:hypothetical protein
LNNDDLPARPRRVFAGSGGSEDTFGHAGAAAKGAALDAVLPQGWDRRAKEAPMTIRRAECSCGQLSATCPAEPSRLSVCHCLNCKRRTGSAFAFTAWFDEGDVVTQGEAHEFDLTGDEGGRATFSFCPRCGVTVFFRPAALPGRIAVPAGTFADPDFPPPTVSVYHDTTRRYPWVEIRAEPLTIIG